MKDMKESQSPCPSCGSANIIVREKRILSASTVVLVAIGLLMITGVLVMMRPTSWSPNMFNLVKIFGLVFGGWFIWDQVTGLPLPLLGIKLFKERYTVNGVCSDCHHKWQETEKK